MGELRIDCGYCGTEFAVTEERVKGFEVPRSEISMAIFDLFGVKDKGRTKTEYRIICPRCNRQVAKFTSPIVDI